MQEHIRGVEFNVKFSSPITLHRPGIWILKVYMLVLCMIKQIPTLALEIFYLVLVPDNFITYIHDTKIFHIQNYWSLNIYAVSYPWDEFCWRLKWNAFFWSISQEWSYLVSTRSLLTWNERTILFCLEHNLCAR